MHKAVAGTTERYEILSNIVGSSSAVLDVVMVPALVGGSAPAAAPPVSGIHLAAEGDRKAGVDHQPDCSLM